MTQVQKELFTELTQKQCETVEGGALLLIESIQALTANADWIGKDDTYMTVDGAKRWGVHKFSSGQNRNVGYFQSFSGSVRVNLFDEDGWLNPDDYMGGRTISDTPTNGAATTIVSGGGSQYAIKYQVI